MNYYLHVFKNIITVILCYIILIFSFSCEDKKGDSDNNEAVNFDTTAVSAGNLLIINQLSEPILLYLADTVFKEIAGSTDFLINIPNPSGTSKELKIWKKSDVLDYLEPDASTIYRRWEVILPNSTSQDDRIVWIIKSGESGVFVGELVFNYPDIDPAGVSVIYSVDVFINNQTGSKITALSPGTQGKKVGLEYGYYLMYYYYWYSDPNSTEGRVNIGWIDSEEDGSGISTLINATNTARTIEVPPYVNSNVGREGIIDITNTSASDVQVWVNSGTLIEAITISTLPTTGLSILEGQGGSYAFLIPEDYYRIEARNMQNGQALEILEEIYVMELHPYQWNISPDNAYNSIQITNNTGENITIHDGDNNEYIGHFIISGQTKTVDINSEIQSLKAKSTNLISEAFLAEITEQWVINDLREAFYLGLESNSFSSGETVQESNVTINWDLGSANAYSNIQLVNALFSPYTETISTGSSSSFTFENLDESPDDSPYRFRINSYNSLGVGYGWQELEFYVDALGTNSLRISPWKQKTTAASSATLPVEFSFDIMFEEVDSVAAAYIEVSYDQNVINLDMENILKGSLFENCDQAIFIFNDNSNDIGTLELNVSFIGGSCGEISGSGHLAIINGFIIGMPEDNKTLISINNNSIFRDKNNTDIDISNISDSDLFNAEIIF